MTEFKATNYVKSPWAPTPKYKEHEKNETAPDIKPITEDEIKGVSDQNRRDPIVIALVGKSDTNKSGVLCEFISKLPAGKVCPILDFDHSITAIRDEFYADHKDKFFIINSTSCGHDYNRGLKIGLMALEKYVKENKDKIGLLASEGADRLLQRSFKMTCKARGYNIEDIKFFGKGGTLEFNSMDWMLRNDYNVDPFDLLYNCAAELGVDLVLTTHTEDKIDNRHEIIAEDEPIWYKTIPDYITYTCTMKEEVEAGKILRTATITKSRVPCELKGRKFIVSEVNITNPEKSVVTFNGLYNQIKPLTRIHF